MNSYNSSVPNLAGLRIAVALIVLANLVAFFALKDGKYRYGTSIVRYSTIGAVYVVVIAITLFKVLRRSPSDGILLGVALSLIGAGANLSSGEDAIEIFGALSALVLGPAIAFGYLVVLMRQPVHVPADPTEAATVPSKDRITPGD